jgi:tetratricopeptide (TPR) repeat protein
MFLGNEMKLTRRAVLAGLCILGVGAGAQATRAASATATTAQASQQKATHHASHTSATAAKQTEPSDAIPVTTSSSAARRYYNQGMVHCEQLLYIDIGTEDFRKAVKADPKFALGHATLAYFTTDPFEEAREMKLADHYIANAKPDEKLLIQWMLGTKDGQLIPAISDMNDLLARYPNDKQFENLAGEWLLSQQQNYDHAEIILEKILKEDPAYFPAMNNLAYCYALGGKPKLAPKLMADYVAALPGQPNPQDSYGEILRMQGDFNDALDHYRTALRIAPNFISSQLGIATTYALMGQEERARAEYVKAIAMAGDRRTKMDYRLQWAMTYFREGDIENGRKGFTNIAKESHAQSLTYDEAESYRAMAFFNPEPSGAMEDLDAGENATQQGKYSKEGRAIELATVWQTRAYLAAKANLADQVEDAQGKLSDAAQDSRDNIVQQSFHSASGALAYVKGEYKQAIDELEQDPENAMSQELLADAEMKAGQTDEARKTLATLAGTNNELIETAYVVPQVRASLKGSDTALHSTSQQ